MVRFCKSLLLKKLVLQFFFVCIVTACVFVLPSAVDCRYDWNITACSLVVFHDFLDHLDGIVAKTQRKVYGPVDDPVLGGYLDAVCDKVR